MAQRECNLDGLIGPTHHYAGLAFGNVASATHRYQVAYPRQAARQGLAKMLRVHQLGVPQGVLPPLRRPRLEFLRQLGWEGDPATLVDQVGKEQPRLLSHVYSASCMWTANAATVSPSADCADGRLHLTTANLSSTLHRSLEGPSTDRLLRAVFADSSRFVVHAPLPSQPGLADEGAANHTRLIPPDAPAGQAGLELFTWGFDPLDEATQRPQRYPARQSRLAAESIARRHGLDPERCLFWQQHPAAIDAGVFHNDVIAVGHQDLLLCHQQAWWDQPQRLAELRQRYDQCFGKPLCVWEVSAEELPLADAVASYLFNSQLLSLPGGGMQLLCPLECQENQAARSALERLLAGDNPVHQVEFVDLRQSMHNGGGPACLRLRVAMTAEEAAAVHPGIWLSESLYSRLVDWVEQHYRPTLTAADLADPGLVGEVEAALQALAQILQLPPEVVLDLA